MSVHTKQNDAPALRRSESRRAGETICVPDEAAVEIRLNGVSSAVLMATPGDLEELAVGFLLTEGSLADAGAVQAIGVREEATGFIVDVVCEQAVQPLGALPRERSTGARSSCGMCGVRTLAQAIMPTPAVRRRALPDDAPIRRALDELTAWQPLNMQTRAVHAAALADPSTGRILAAREDIGRHNALDKLLGALARRKDDIDGFVLITSRCSYEMVQKAAMRNVGTLVAISAPTGLAIRLAREAGMNLVAIARSDSDLVFHSAGGSDE